MRGWLIFCFLFVRFANATPLANLVIGQSSFTSVVPNNPLFYPIAGKYIGGLTYISDIQNNAIYVFNASNLSFVVGSNNGITSKNGLSHPNFIDTDGTRLVVADGGSNRVVIWNSLPTNANSTIDVVLGQTTFNDSSLHNPSNTTLNDPVGLSIANGKLIVADNKWNRLLIWNKIPNTTNTGADLVLGQPNFTTTTASCTALTFNNPSSVYSDGTILVVADTLNLRVLIWKQFPANNTVPADIVLGQSNMTTCATSLQANSMNFLEPTGVYVWDERLYVNDFAANRILIWNKVGLLTNGASADAVWGQPNFTTSSYGATQQTLYGPASLFPVSLTEVYVVDTQNSRVLGFPVIPSITESPSRSPSKAPSSAPTTSSPSNTPTTSSPSAAPTPKPTKRPTTRSPSRSPTTSNPTTTPSGHPTPQPTITFERGGTGVQIVTMAATMGVLFPSTIFWLLLYA